MKKKRFQVGDSFYEIPDNEVSAFLSDNPKAVEVRYYDLDGSKYNIPLSEVDAFENEMGLKKKEPSIIGKIGSLVGSGGGDVGLSEEEKIGKALRTVATSGGTDATQPQAPQLDPDDPLKSALNPIRNKIAELRQVPVAESTAQNGIAKQVQSERVDNILKKQNLLQNARFNNAEEAKGFVKSKLDPAKLVLKGEIDITKQPTLDDYTEESIIAAAPQDNETVQVGLKQYFDNKTVRDAVYSSASLSEAALKAAAGKGDLVGKQLQELDGIIPNAMKGNIVLSFLNNPDLRELAAKDPELAQKINTEMYNFPQQYPAAAMRMLSKFISNEREKRGENTSILNITSAKTSDKIIEDLVERGELLIQFKNFYDIPAVRFFVNRNLKTSGFIENLASGIDTGLTGISKTVGAIGDIGMSEFTDQTKLFNKLEKDYSDYKFKPKGLLHNLTTAGGLVTGQILPMVVGGNYLMAAKLVKSPMIASDIMIGLQSFGYNKERALADLPGESEAKQLAYATVNTGIEIALERWVNDIKLARDLVKGASPKVKSIIDKFTSKEINAAAAKAEANNLFKNLLNAAGKFAKKGSKVAITEANEEGATSALQNATNQVFGGEPMSFNQVASEAFETWKTTLLGSAPLGAVGGIVGMRRDPNAAELIYEMSANPEHYKDIMKGEAAIDEDYAKDLPQKIANLDYAATVRKSVEARTDLNEKQKQQLVVSSLSKKILETKAASLPDKLLAKPEEKKIAEIEIEQEKILNPEMTNTELIKEFYENELLGRGSMDMLSGAETKKFDESKVGDYLKFVAQQANNLDENWKPHEGKAPNVSQIPEAIVEAANERWKKEIEAAQPKIDQDRELEFEPEVESGVSVIRPEENVPPNVVPLVTIEAPPQETAKTTVSEPKSGKVAELEAQRDAEILDKGKPEVNLVFVSAKELVNSKDPIGNKKIHNDIKERYKELKSLIDCLWGKIS